MHTGTCEYCGRDNDGGRLCLRCDHWETLLGRAKLLGLPSTLLSELKALRQAAERRVELAEGLDGYVDLSAGIIDVRLGGSYGTKDKRADIHALIALLTDELENQHDA